MLVIETIAHALNVDIKKLYIATSDINELRNLLDKSIEEHGLHHAKTYRISKAIDIAINKYYKNQNVENNKNSKK